MAETGAPEPAKTDDDKQASVDKDDDVKPDFGQSDNVDVDPNQGAINMGFDDKDEDEAPKGGKDKEDEEVSKSIYLGLRMRCHKMFLILV